MKKLTEKEIVFCDFCKKEALYGYKCFVCGIDSCFDCGKNNIVVYTCGVGFSSSRDGYYCISCDALMNHKDDPLHNAYIAIKKLKKERDDFYADFEIKTKKAEALIEQLFKNKY